MDVRNGKVVKLTDDILSEVAGGLNEKRPLITGLKTDDKIDKMNKEKENLNNEKNHEIE